MNHEEYLADFQSKQDRVYDQRQERIKLIATMAATIYSGLDGQLKHVDAVTMSISRAKHILLAVEQACPP